MEEPHVIGERVGPVEPDVFKSILNTFFVQESVRDLVLVFDVQLDGFEIVITHNNGVKFIALDHTENLLLEPNLEDFIDVVDGLFLAEKGLAAYSERLVLIGGLVLISQGDQELRCQLLIFLVFARV
jgi:hypothetical protein